MDMSSMMGGMPGMDGGPDSDDDDEGEPLLPSLFLKVVCTGWACMHALLQHVTRCMCLVCPDAVLWSGIRRGELPGGVSRAL